MLVSWEIWKERNAQIFKNQASAVNILTMKNKDGIVLWSHAGTQALKLLNFMSRE
jgi:hypothetical protein